MLVTSTSSLIQYTVLCTLYSTLQSGVGWSTLYNVFLQRPVNSIREDNADSPIKKKKHFITSARLCTWYAATCS